MRRGNQQGDITGVQQAGKGPGSRIDNRLVLGKTRGNRRALSLCKWGQAGGK